jgi:hypothetical protein
MKIKVGTLSGNPKEIYIEPRLKEMLDLFSIRLKKKRDALLLIDGNEGEGKSNMATTCGAYMGEILGRPYTVDNVFFDINKMLEFAINTKEQIIHWDEGALGGLASEWWNKNQIQFIKLLMVARKKKHFFIICIPKFYKLTEYIACDRSLGLAHVYSADNLEQGRFTYYNSMSKEKLYDNWKRKHMKTFRTGYNFHGRFTETLPVVLNEDLYEKKKDEAILSMGEKTKLDKNLIKFKEVEEKILLCDEISAELKGFFLGNTERTIENKKGDLKRKKREENVDKTTI